MKKIVLSVTGIATLFLSIALFTSCNKEELMETTTSSTELSKDNSSSERRFVNDEEHLLEFEKSVAIVTYKERRQKENEVIGVVCMEIRNFNPNFNLRSIYTINGKDYNDDGTFNDLVANDGKYTSVDNKIFNNLIDVNEPKFLLLSDNFTHTTQLYNNINKWEVSVGCKMRITRKGTTWLGYSCSGGCIELYDCEFDVTWSS